MPLTFAPAERRMSVGGAGRVVMTMNKGGKRRHASRNMNVRNMPDVAGGEPNNVMLLITLAGVALEPLADPNFLLWRRHW